MNGTKNMPVFEKELERLFGERHQTYVEKDICKILGDYLHSNICKSLAKEICDYFLVTGLMSQGAFLNYESWKEWRAKHYNNTTKESE